MNKKLLNLLCDVFKISAELIDENTSPKNLPEWDSLATVNLIVALESEFCFTFSMDEIVRLESVGAIDQLLHEKGVME